jgi:hypothetical protein
MYKETKYCNLEISPFYIKNTFKMYVKCAGVKSVTIYFTLIAERVFSSCPLNGSHGIGKLSGGE